MFYLVLSIVMAVLIATYCVLKFCFFKENDKFNNIINKILKISSIVFVCIMLVSVLLPDAFALCYSKEDLVNMPARYGYSIVRWFSMVAFVSLPIAVFYKNRTMRNISIYFGTLLTIFQICFFKDYIADFTSTSGRGLNSIPVISEGFKQFLINPTFRGIWFGMLLCLQLVISVILAIQEKHVFDFKNKKEYLYFFITLPCMILSVVPIYVMQHLFGHTNLIFEAYGIVHFGWMIFLAGEIVALYYIFRRQNQETKMVLLFVLSLSLIMQYLQMFSAISINIERLPFQLCNLGSFFILLSLITKNKHLFNFTVIINVIGVLFAVASPDLDGKGLFYLYNMHFILEHTNVLVIPILALLFGIFPRLDKTALKDCLLGFTIYFVCAWALGTTFNAIALKTGNSFWKANYLFMFDASKAVKLLGDGIGKLFVSFKIGYGTFYPAIQLIIYAVFMIVCFLLWLAIQFIYKLKDIKKDKKQKLAVAGDAVMNEDVKKQDSETNEENN